MDIQVLRSFLSRKVPEIPARYLADAMRKEAVPGEAGSIEEQLLCDEARTILALTGPREIARIGPGGTRKLRHLLDAGSGLRSCAILGESGARAARIAARLTGDYPHLAVRAVEGDYQRDAARLGPGGERLLVVLGRAFGALHPREVRPFLDRLARAMAPTDVVLLGVGLAHEPAPSRDVEGFHARVLQAANHRYGADFDAAVFEHVDRWDPRVGARELRLRARCRVQVRVPAAGLILDLAPGQEIRTEVRCRYTRARLLRLVERTGLQLFGWLGEAEERFAFALLTPRRERTAR